MDILSLILGCAFASVDDDVLVAIARKQSALAPYYLRLEGETQGQSYPDEAQAAEAIAKPRAEGQRLYIGLLGVPSDAAEAYQVTPRALLEPCTNVAIGSDLIAQALAACRRSRSPDPVYCAAQHYGARTGQDPNAFAQAVMLSAMLERKNSSGFSAEFSQKTGEGNGASALFLDVQIEAPSATRVAGSLGESP
jgi:hypothetical protein